MDTNSNFKEHWRIKEAFTTIHHTTLYSWEETASATTQKDTNLETAEAMDNALPQEPTRKREESCACNEEAHEIVEVQRRRRGVCWRPKKSWRRRRVHDMKWRQRHVKCFLGEKTLLDSTDSMKTSKGHWSRWWRVSRQMLHVFAADLPLRSHKARRLALCCVLVHYSGYGRVAIF